MKSLIIDAALSIACILLFVASFALVHATELSTDITFVVFCFVSASILSLAGIAVLCALFFDYFTE